MKELEGQPQSNLSHQEVEDHYKQLMVCCERERGRDREREREGEIERERGREREGEIEGCDKARQGGISKYSS